MVVPFLLGGLEAGEPTVIALGERNAVLVRAALPAGSPVLYLTGGDVYARPASAIRSYQRLLAEHVAAGAGQIRIVGELTPQSFGATWDWWARYESAINHAYDEFPLWSMCAYDLRTTPSPVLDDVLRTHPRTALPDGGHRPNHGYLEPATYLGRPRRPVTDPIELTPPRLDLADPTPFAARQAVRAGVGGSLTEPDRDDLLVAVSEMVSNAQRHGRGPTRLRVWTTADRVVVAVSDSGAGPTDPFAGLLPAPRADGGGLGLWITHQSCSHVSLERRDDGFTVRLTAGTPL